MDQNWRFSAKSVTKYNPKFRDDNGHYKNQDWIGFFQIGKNFNGEILTFDHYLEIETRYILAAKLFFKFHNCSDILIKNLEKHSFSDYNYFDKEHLGIVFNKMEEGMSIPVTEVDLVIQLILRDLAWAELLCENNINTAVRFGYDFYMYFNSDLNIDPLIKEVSELGLFVW